MSETIPTEPVASDLIASLQALVADLETRIDALEAAATAPALTPAGIEAVEAKVQMILERIGWA